MTFNLNRNRLHYEFIRNRRLISQLDMEFFALRQRAMNHGFGGWVSSFSLVRSQYVTHASESISCKGRQVSRM